MGQGLNCFAFIVGLLCCLADVARATDGECPIEYSSPITKEQVKSAIRDEGVVVFTGTVESIRQIKPFRPGKEVTFSVSQWWKGTSQRRIVLTTGGFDDCGYGFFLGRKYLVYAEGNLGGIATDCCTPTKPLSQAKADLAILGPGYSPFNPLPRLLVMIGVTLVLGVFYWRRK